MTGRRIGRERNRFWLLWLLPLAGLFSLIWFLIRVIPKPSRATYPCQRLAAPFATGFVVWITGLIGSAVAYRKAKLFMRQSRYVVALTCFAVGIMALWVSLSLTTQAPATAEFVPSEPANSPMGLAKGIHPGRVVWVHDPGATSWDGSTGRWWDDDNTDQEAVDVMVSKTIQNLTGQASDAESWDALFKHFNGAGGRAEVGYQQGEKIAIKINMNQENSSGGNWSSSVGNPSPHVILSVLKQLIEVAGVPGSAITIYDASRYIGNPIYDKIRGYPNPEFLNVRFVVKNSLARNGRLAAIHDPFNPLHTKAGTAYLPQSVTSAKYLINMALLRPHSMFGITLCAKNHFGSTYFPSGGGWTPSPMHSYGQRSNPMASYNCLVNLNGHRHLSGKTLLYMIDGLYPARNQSSNVLKWASFGDDWFSGMLASQDPIAIDSVGLDFLRHEDALSQPITDVTGNPDNYLHEAAQADSPPSGTAYDPEGDGTRLTSLGVHEHWNNPVDRQYSRNLGTGDGIELVIASFATEDGPIENATTGLKYDQLRYAIGEARSGDTIILSEGSYPGDIDFAGKNLTFTSIDPDDPAVVAATIIGGGGGKGVTFSGGQDATCVLAGFTITGADTGIYCSGSSPTIADCRIEGNAGAGIELYNGSNPTITNCEISANVGAGIEMLVLQSGRIVLYNEPAITNCVIAANGQSGVSGGMPTIANCTIVANGAYGISGIAPAIADSIIYYNGLDAGLAQVDGTSATVSYSNIQGGWPGEGNIDAVPCFAEPGFWSMGGSLDDVTDDFWVRGDYHLRSQAGRWDPVARSWVQDVITSPCIDAGNPAMDCSAESMPNGGRVNMGAHGGTAEASKSVAE
jgi:parallel beta-helix repeat protein